MSHTVVLRPLKAGYFTSATITYLAQEGAQVVVSGRFMGALRMRSWSRVVGDDACPCALTLPGSGARRKGGKACLFPAFSRLASLVLPGREESWLSVTLTEGSPLTL